MLPASLFLNYPSHGATESALQVQLKSGLSLYMRMCEQNEAVGEEEGAGGSRRVHSEALHKTLLLWPNQHEWDGRCM
jgi:hypothetical protein